MKWSQIKRVISLTLCVMMVLALLPTSTLAEDTAPTEPSATAEPSTTAEPSAPAETTAAEVTPAAETTTLVEEASPTPVAENTDEATPVPSETPLPSETPVEEIIPEGPVTYLVNFVVDGETLWDLQQTVAEGETVKAPSIPQVPDSEAYVGQVFLYWYVRANEAYDFGTPVTANLTLIAKFGVTEEAPVIKEEPAVLDDGMLFAAFSMEGGILPETTPLWTYTFVVDGASVSTKIVANGDTLDEPEVPAAPDGQKFAGWFTDANTLFDSFGTQTVTEDGATTLTAKFEPAYSVFFYNQFGSVFMTVTPDASNVVTMPSSAALQVAADEVLVGWTLTAGDTTDVGASVTVDGASINLYPIIQKVIWISFDSAGGTYLSPMHIQPGDKLTLAAVEAYIATQNNGSSTISKVGYTFAGWTGFTFGQRPSSNVTLTATWTAQTVGYTVLFWQQAVVGDSYAVVAADTVTSRTALSGSSVSPISADTTKSYKGFDYNATKSVAVTVKGDGSTVLNVYYDRQIWTVNWLMRTKTYSNTFSAYNSFFTWTTRSGRYGSKINYWPVASEITSYYSGGMSGYTHTGWFQNAENSGTKLSYLEIFADGGTQLFFSGVLNLYAQYTNTYVTTDTFNHILQNLDLSWPSTPYVTAYGYNVGSFGINNRFEGFTAAYYNTNTNSTWQTAIPGSTSVPLDSIDTLNIRHSRNSYTLSVFNYNTAIGSSTVLYEKSLSTYVPATPSSPPAGVPSDYVWAGWYTTQAGYAGSEMNWTGTMPAHDLIVYGVWKQPSFTGIAHSVSFGTSGGTVVDLGSIEYGGTISASALAVAQAAAEASKPNPTDAFGGWLIMKSGSLILFNSSMQIYENVVLYPVWIGTENFSITYSLGEATGTAPVDSVTYGAGSQAQVKSLTLASVTPPPEKVFIGWRSSVDSKIYYPNSLITIIEDTTLTAVWVYSSVTVTITYDGNGGATADNLTTFTGGAINNTYHTVQSNPFLYAGKNFTGWNTASDGSGSWYNPGDSVLLGVSVPTAPGSLYAIWEDQTFDVTVTADPVEGVSSKSGAGIFVYNASTTVTWTLAAGYEVTSVTDNGTTVDAASYVGNSYTLSGIIEDHAVVINTQKTLFTLSYDGNGGLAGGNPSYSSTKTMGTSFTVDANTFTRDGYYFLGWNTDSAATAADANYAPGSSVVMPSSNLTLYAVWAEKTALTLTANSATRNYDGSVKSVSGITPSIAGLTIQNTTAGASGTNPGVYATTFTDQAGLVILSGGVDVTEQYTVSWVDGALTINPQVTYRASANGAVIGTEWVAYGTGDATYNVTPPQSITVGATNFYWLGTYNPASANDLTENTTIYASYTQNKTLVITADSAAYTYDGTTRQITTGSVNVPGLTVTGYTVSGSGTSAGTYPTSVTLGEVKIMDGSTDVTYQYDVSTADGLLTIDPANTTADSDGYTGTYDALPHGITVTPAVDGSTVRYSLTASTDPADYTLTTSPTATDATAGTTVYFVVTNPNYNPVFGSEVITINKRVVALTTEDASKMYDGSALTNPNWNYDTTGNDGFVAGQGFATATADGTITNVGTAENTFSYTLTAATNADNYTIDVTKGTLTITASTALTVDATDVTEMYDGTAYGVSASANVPAGTVIRYSETPSTDPADYTLTASPTAMHVDDSKTVYFVATNPNYAPAFGSADITITPRDIMVTGATQSRAYDGTALSDSSVTLAGDGFLAGEGYETMPTATSTITNVGSVNNIVAAGTLNAATDPHDYSISTTSGTLTVTARELTVQADDQQIAYPADRPANATLTYTLVDGSLSGETPAYVGALGYDAAQLPASQPYSPDTYEKAIVGGTLALTNSGAFKASNYTLTVLPGDLKVVNGGFTVDLTGGSWTYDGDPHGPVLTGTTAGDTVEYFIPDGTGGWTSTGTTPPTVTNVSDGPLTVKVVVTRPGYDPAEDTTTLTITPANTTADSDGYTGTYDAVAHGITVTPAVDGSTVRYSLTDSTDPADYTLTTSPTATDATTGTTVCFVVTNPNYNPVFGSEEIVINKRVVALTTEDASKMYDGSALTNPNWNYDTTGNDGFVAGQGFATATADGTITNVGTAENTFSYTLTASTNADNYTIDVTKGTLTITASTALTVDATDVTEMYDGTAYGVSASANVPTGTTIRYSETPSSDPASYTLTASPTATHVDDSKTVYFVATNPNYAPAFGNADVTITPRDIMVTGATQSRAYDGTALSDSSVTLSGDGFLAGEGYEILPTATSTITNVGSVNNIVAAGTLNAATDPHDYSISTTSGTLTVTARELTVQADNQQIAYPADRPANATLTYTLVDGSLASETPAYIGALGYDAAQLPASQPYTPDTYEKAIVGGTLALTNSGAFKASNYTLTVLPGDLKVVNGGFTVDLTGGSWTYDGDPHGPVLTGTTTGDTVEYFIPDGTGGWTSTGTTPPTVTNVSDGPLTVKVVVTRPGYDPAEDTTTLTITPANTTADSDGYTGTYDAVAHGITVTPAVDGSTVRYSLTNSTDPADYTLTTSPTATDATTGTTVYFVVTNPNYNPVFGSEVITINKRVVALTTEDASKMYDGSALTNPNWNYDATGNDGFVAGQGFATATADGTITNVGTAENTFSYTLTAATNADNYTIDVTKGTLTITASTALTVDATDVTEMYDGTAYGVSASANVPAGTVIRYSETPSSDPAAYTLTSSPTATHVDDSKTVYFVATNANYQPAFGNADVTITPRDIMVTGATQSRAYDGTALSDSSVTLSGDGFLAGEGYEILPTATSTITNVGSVNNIVAAGTLNAATDPHDYSISTTPGTLTVTARELTVQADNQQIAYPADRPANATLTYTLVDGSLASETPAYVGALGYDAAQLPASQPYSPDTYEKAIVGGTLALTNSGAFKASNYTLTVLPGDLKVVNGGFTVDLTGGSWTYDGDPHGPTLTGTTAGDTVEYFIPDGTGGWTSTGTTPPTVTNVSDGPLTIKVVVTRPGYDPAEDTTTLTIDPANTTADSDGYTGTYDNLPHGITVTPAISGSTVKYSLTNSTDPADYTLTTSPTATDATAGTTVYFVVTNPNYNPVFGSEVITINKRVVALTTEDASKMYDGSALTNPNWNYDTTGNDGFVAGQGFATATADGTITNVGTAENTFSYTLNGSTNADNYTIDVTKGKLSITASTALTVDATDVTEMYDGTAYGVSASANVPTGTVIRYSETPSSDPAAYTLTTSPTATHVDDSKTVYFVATNPNYAPAFGSADVTITPRDIMVTGATRSRAYDGTALSDSSVTLSGDGFLASEGYETMPTATSTITNVGSVNNIVAAGTLNAATDPHDYSISTTPGTLTVTARELTVQADDQQIAYPADRPANATLTYTLVDGSLASETPAYVGALGYDSALASDPLTPDTYTDAIVAGTLALTNSGAFKASNYTLTVLPGDLKVVNGGFTVDLTGGSWTYDGDPHGPTLTGTTTGDTVEYFISDGAGGWTSTGTTPPTVTNVSDGPLTVKVVVTRPGYDPAEDTTTLTITPANTTADSDGYTGTYDAVAHGITVTPAISGSTVKYNLTDSTDPADYTLTTSPTATDATTGTMVYFVVTNPNYNPVFGSEVITINKRVVALTTEDASKMYDGSALTNPNWNYDTTGNDGFVAGQGFATATADGTITNVGTAENTFSYTLTAATNADNYTIDVTKGTLTITASTALTVDATDVTEMYDGTAYGASASANVPAGTVIRYSETYSSDPAAYTLTTSPTATHVDDSKTVYFVATNPNYAPAFGSADVTITARDIVVDTASATRVYNGLALSANGWLVDNTSSGFVGSEGFATAATTGSIINVGTANNTFAYTLKTNTLAADYSISVVPGVLTVVPRPVLIVATDTDKNFGSSDPVFGYTVPTGDIGGTTYFAILPADLGGITVTVNRLGYDTDVGTYADVLLPAINTTPAILANYVFVTQTADLTINPQVVYNLNTTDAVTGFPQTQWFDLGSDAVVANADGVKRAGFRLIGWDDATTGDPIALGGAIPAISSNHALNAVWEIALYDVIYDSGTTDQVDRMPANVADKAYNTALTVATNIPYRSGYDFLYWMTTDIDGTEKQLVPGAAFNMPDGDMTLKAVWDPRSSPIYYHANGADGGTYEAGRFFTDSIVTIAGNMFSRPGYRFLGWSEGSSTAGVSQQPGYSFYMPPRQVNLYAQWEKLSFTVTYIVSGGTGDLDGTTPYAVYTDLSYGDTMPIPANPTLNGYTFEGWTTAIPATVPDGDLVIYGSMKIAGQEDEPEKVVDEQTPLAGGPVWALLNLILTIATALASILMLIGLFGKKKEERDGLVIRETEKHPVTRMLTLLPGIGAIIAFILTENMRNPMVFTDRWTLLMAIIALVQLVLVVFGAKKDRDPDYDSLSSAPKAE